jgi:hypothetical protein
VVPDNYEAAPDPAPGWKNDAVPVPAPTLFPKAYIVQNSQMYTL